MSIKQAGIPRYLKDAIKSGKKFPVGSAQAKAINKHLAGKCLALSSGLRTIEQ